MILVKNITKRYYSLVAVNDLTFTIPRGEVLGILGPNGAGKTTLFKLIAGFLNPDEGEIIPMNGQSGHWPAIGYKPERLLFPNQMRVEEYLKMMAHLSNLKGTAATEAVSTALQQVKMEDARHKQIGDCSKGMRQRLSLAQSLIGRPSLLLIDEPSNGLDPEGQADICQIISELHQAGHTIVMSSHQLPEVTRVCTQLIILKQGRIHYRGGMEEALSLRPHVTIEADKYLGAISGILKSLHPDLEVEDNCVILNNDAIRMRRHVVSLLVGTGFDIVRIAQKRTTLEEIYAEAVQWHNGS